MNENLTKLCEIRLFIFANYISTQLLRAALVLSECFEKTISSKNQNLKI